MWCVCVCVIDQWELRLELRVVQLHTVVEDEVVGGGEAGLHTVPDHLGGPRRTGHLQNLGTTRQKPSEPQEHPYP